VVRKEKLGWAKIGVAQVGCVLLILAQTNFAMSAKLCFLSLIAASCPVAAQFSVREMSTDRPDITESPYSVPQGMGQVEMSFFDYERDVSQAGDAWIYGQVNLKYGLSSSSDVQLVVHSYEGALSGFGDVALRYKQNLWGNDEGKTAFALMPFLTIPTQSESAGWAGGVVMPLAVTLTERVCLGLQSQLSMVPDAESSGHDLECLLSGTLGFTLTERLGVFTELVGIFTEDADAIGLFDTGLTYAVAEDAVLDAGVRIGLNSAAPDLGIFTGVSFRF
jgi:hypothetical protein